VLTLNAGSQNSRPTTRASMKNWQISTLIVAWTPNSQSGSPDGVIVQP
jgi:hypothetical protein